MPVVDGPEPMVNGLVLEVTPLPVSVTDTVAGPAVVKKLAGIVAVMEFAVNPALTVNPVAPPPLNDQLTTGVVAVGKLAPVSTRVTLDWLTSAEAGLMPLMNGPGSTV